MTATVPETSAPELDGFRYLGHLGSGGYSQVYLYEQDMPRRKVAVKVLNDTGLTEAVRRQFTAEANAMAGLADHPHIVQVFHAAVTADGRPYLVMQYYPQPNLNVRARREHFSVADVLRIGIQIGSAVETAHRTGILHRDIKPHNILTGQFGSPALTDFGIATTKGSDDEGAEGMSVPWSPPEVLYGTSDADERSDVYSLAATVWHLLVGRSPFEEPGGDNSTLALMRRIQSTPAPSTGRGDVPDSLERLLRQGLAKDPAARPQSALDFVRALQAVEQELRLPLTQIVVSIDADSATDTPAPDQGDATRVRSARKIEAQPRTVARAPTVPDAQPVTHAVDDGAAVQPVPRQRQMPTVGDEPTTLRPKTVAPDSGDEPVADDTPPKHRRHVIPAVAAGLLVVVAVGVGVALSGHGGGAPKDPVTSNPDAGDSALGPGANAPGTPKISAKLVKPSSVRFSWSYADAQEGDVFHWREVSPRTVSGVAKTTTVTFPRKHGGSVCLTVQAVRAQGGQASTMSDPVCAP